MPLNIATYLINATNVTKFPLLPSCLPHWTSSLLHFASNTPHQVAILPVWTPFSLHAESDTLLSCYNTLPSQFPTPVPSTDACLAGPHLMALDSDLI